MQAVGKDLRLKTLILWLADIGVLLYSYVYFTAPKQFDLLLAQIIKTSPDPETMSSSEFRIIFHQMYSTMFLVMVTLFVLLHSFVFYRYAIGKKAATTYVIYYSLMAGLSLSGWIIFSYEKTHLSLIPSAVALLWVFGTEFLKRYRPT